MSCPTLLPLRTQFLADVAATMPLAGAAGRILQLLITSTMKSDLPHALRLIAGDEPFLPCPPGSDKDRHADQCGKAMLILDKLSKSFLVQCWRRRAALIGSFTVDAAQLRISLPPLVPSLIRPHHDPRNAVSQALFLREWSRWVPRSPSPLSVNRKGKRKGWHVVWKGRKMGLFYRWCDTLNSIVGIPDALHKGYNSESEAIEALNRPGPGIRPLLTPEDLGLSHPTD